MMSDQNDNDARSRRRRQRRSYALLILAAGMLAFGVAAGTLYYVLRPTTLRIAVGPAGSEDQKLIQLMAQTFARENSAVRLSLVTTEGTAESIALFTAGKADLAVARGDLNLPTNAELVAILRKNVVVLWAPSGLPAKGSKKQSGTQDQESRRTRRPPRRRDRADAGQCHAAARDPERVRHQSRQGHDQPVCHQPDQRDGARSVGRRLHGGRPAQEQDHRGRDRGDGGRPAASRNSCRSTLRTRSRRRIRSTNPRKFPPASSAPRRSGRKTRSTPSPSIT